MSNPTPQRTLVITIKAPRGLTESEATALADQVRKIVGGDKYRMAAQQIVGAQRIKVSPYGRKGERLQEISQCPAEMTAGQIADSLGLSERQVHRYRALLKALVPPSDTEM